MTTTTLIALALAIIATVALIKALRLRWELRQARDGWERASMTAANWHDRARKLAEELGDYPARNKATGRFTSRNAPNLPAKAPHSAKSEK